MRKKLFYILSVLLITLLLPLTVFAKVGFREVNARIGEDGRLILEGEVSGLGKNPGDLTAGGYRIKVLTKAYVQYACVNPAGNVPHSTLNTWVFDGDFAILPDPIFENSSGTATFIVAISIDYDFLEAMCSEDHDLRVDKIEWDDVGTVILYSDIDDGVDVINYSIGGY